MPEKAEEAKARVAEAKEERTAAKEERQAEKKFGPPDPVPSDPVDEEVPLAGSQGGQADPETSNNPEPETK